MAKNTIKLKNYLNINVEYAAAAAITPGHLVELTSAGTVQVNGTAADTSAAKWFAFEDELQGKNIDTAFSAGDKVQVWCTIPGDEVYAYLKDGQNVAIGAMLESAGDGSLKAVSTAGTTLAVALEAVDLSASANTTNARIKVRIV